MSARSVTRKRSRAQFNEEDELVSESNKTPLSNTKRKKANVSTSTPGSGTVFGSIKKKFGGIPGFPEPSKENATLEDDEDELASIEVYTPRMKRAEKDIYDVPSSPEEERRIVQRNGGADRMEHAPSLKKLTPALVQGSTSQNRKGKPSGDMYDFPDGDSTPRQGRKSASSVERAKAHLAPIAQASSTEVPKRGRGRPRKSEILKQAKQLSNKAMREKMMAVTEADSEDVGESGTPRLDSRRPKRKEDSEDPALQSDATIVVQSTVKLTAAARELKSALTPIKRNRGRPRKSVAFEEAEEVAFGFKDIPASASAQKASKYRLGAIASENVPDSKGLSKPEVELDLQSASDEDGEEACARCSGVDFEDANPIILCDNCDYGIHLKCSKLRKVPKGSWLCPNCTPKPKADDLYCRICSRPDSTKKNQIILCETCDYGIHLDCSDMKEIPEEEWYCPECKPEPEKDLDIPFGVTSKVSSRCPKIDGFEDFLRRTQRLILGKLTGQRRMKLMGYEDEMQKVYQVVEQTILAGEGNSMLVIGARGCGKTTLVETVISDLSPNHREIFHVVRLNGFIHTDDKLALKEIWRQLGREMDVEDEGKSNYADTLASLLALLSHPSEMSGSQSNTYQTAKSVVFILDEFDLFTTHSRQTLLYNLFDIAQARKAPIVVLGLTTRIDVVESLEKRVKSRFSHRYVHLPLPRSLPAFWEICKEGMMIEPKELGDITEGTDTSSQEEFLSHWQQMVQDLYEKDTAFKHYIQSQFFRSKSVPAFFASCILPVAHLSVQNFPLTGKDFMAYQSLAPPDSKLQILQGLAELELALLIAAARLDIIQDTDTCNFAMAYDEYSSLTSRHKIQTSSTGVAALGAGAKVWGRDVALGAWEKLADYDLLVPAGIGGGAARDFSAGGRMWKVDVGLEEITGSLEGLSTVMAKWCREI